MFYYKSNRNSSQLEVNIQRTFTEADFDRTLIFMEAFMEDSNEDVIFKVLPELEAHVQHILNSHNQTYSNYNITVNVA